MCRDVPLVLDQLIIDRLLGVGGRAIGQLHMVDNLPHEMEAVEMVADHHVERRRRRALLFEPVDVDILVVGTLVGEPMN